ncbi:hypothetical protein ACFU0X_20465 [Streptomyces cellulosae]|uniref:Uncharacterized protein n=1 Tax=Streptomyces cellulosae TaxID=1968 RepID=A0ABW6JM47_STRCE
MSSAVYTVKTVTGETVDTRTEGKAADKLARRLADETGVAHIVYTPTGRVRLEVEVQADDVQELAVEPVTVETLTAEVDADAFADLLLAECEAVIEVREVAVASYASVMDRLTSDDADEKAGAVEEWERRLAIYKEASRAADPADRIVGPKMAAALERGATDDGRTRAALIRRGLAQAGEGNALIVNEAGRKALEDALAAVA